MIEGGAWIMRRRMTDWFATLGLLLVVVGVAGCESPKAWTKGGGNERAFAETRATCQRASARTPLDSISAGYSDRFQACMEGEGWRLVAAPAGAR